MYQHQDSPAGRPGRTTKKPYHKLAGSAVRTARLGFVALIPLLLLTLILLCCIQQIESAAEASAKSSTSSPLSQPPVIPKAPGRYLHVIGRIRLASCSGFSELSATAEFAPIEIWFNERTISQWCIASTNALAYAASKQSYIFTQCDNAEMSVDAIPACAYSNVPSLGHFLWGRELFPLEESVARCRQQSIIASNATDESGNKTIQITILPAEAGDCRGDTGDKICSWFNPAFKKVYVFDSRTQDLISVSINIAVRGEPVVLFETSSITYSSSSDPPASIVAAVEKFNLQAASDLASTRLNGI